MPSSDIKCDSRAGLEHVPDRDVLEPEEESEGDNDVRDYQLAKDRKMRDIKLPKRYAYPYLIAFVLTAAQGIVTDKPKTYSEAVSSKDLEKLMAAMDEEMQSLIKNHAWDLILRPAEKKVVSCKWIYKIKEGISGVESQRFKARLFAKGFTQNENIDFNKVFSPVVKYSSLRILLAIVPVDDMHLDHMDIKTTFLYGELDEMIVMAQP